MNYMQIEAIRKEVKTSIKKGVPAEQLTVIKIHKNDRSAISWVREGKEFMYQGGMYDIVSAYTVQDTQLYQCITDTQEDALFRYLDDLVNRTSHTKKAGQKTNVSREYLVLEVCQIPAITCALVQHNKVFKRYTLNHGFSSVGTPPPDTLRG